MKSNGITEITIQPEFPKQNEEDLEDGLKNLIQVRINFFLKLHILNFQNYYFFQKYLWFLDMFSNLSTIKLFVSKMLYKGCNQKITRNKRQINLTKNQHHHNSIVPICLLLFLIFMTWNKSKILYSFWKHLYIIYHGVLYLGIFVGSQNMTQICTWKHFFWSHFLCSFFKSSLESQRKWLHYMLSIFFYKRKLFTVCVRIVFIVGIYFFKYFHYKMSSKMRYVSVCLECFFQSKVLEGANCNN